MISKGDRVQLREGSRYRKMLLDPDAVGEVCAEDGLRAWVQFEDPPQYAAAWLRSEFVKASAGAPTATGTKGSF